MLNNINVKKIGFLIALLCLSASSALADDGTSFQWNNPDSKCEMFRRGVFEGDVSSIFCGGLYRASFEKSGKKSSEQQGRANEDERASGLDRKTGIIPAGVSNPNETASSAKNAI